MDVFTLTVKTIATGLKLQFHHLNFTGGIFGFLLLLYNIICMKSFWERFSVTKLVLLLLVLCLIFIEIRNVITGGEVDQLFTNVVIAVVSFYFGQKGISYDEPDSLVEVDSKIGFNLDDNNEEDGGTN